MSTKVLNKNYKKNNKKELDNTTINESENEINNNEISDSENDDNDDSDNDESDNDESDNDEIDEKDVDNNDDKDKQLEKKEKSKKLTHDEIITEINNILESESILENEILELEKILTTKLKLRTNYRRMKNKYIGLLPKAYIDGLNKARKEKKKRTNNSKSGILAEHPIPPILLKFLNLPENTLMMRPKVFSLLNNKFKELGLKKGQETIIDKKTAKIFDIEEGHIIKFQDCQKFLADIYDKANNNKVNGITI
jgi:hypothetical protein